MLEIIDLGLIDYSLALEMQKAQVSAQMERIFVCEHPSVISVGRARDAVSDILSSTIPHLDVERGGKSTLHMPGQIVVYPIVNLKLRGYDQVQWLRFLEKVIIELLADFRITATTNGKEAGVWVGEGRRKIASLGIAVKNEMSFHGLSLNVSPDLDLYKNLKPCGYEASVMTSMEKEITPEYWKTWKLTGENLMHRVRLRLAEVLEEEI